MQGLAGHVQVGTLLREYVHADVRLPALSLSIGIASDDHGRAESLDQLIRDADRKLDAAKDAGRDRIVTQGSGELAFDAAAEPAAR